MRPAILFLAALVALRQTPNLHLSGDWDAVCVGPPGDDPNWPKALHTGIPTKLYLNVSGGNISGTAVVDYWPGLSDISDGRMDGDRFSFTLTGRSPSRSWSPERGEVVLYPVMYIVGILRADEITYTFKWGKFQTEMNGKRVTENRN